MRRLVHTLGRWRRTHCETCRRRITDTQAAMAVGPGAKRLAHLPCADAGYDAGYAAALRDTGDLPLQPTRADRDARWTALYFDDSRHGRALDFETGAIPKTVTRLREILDAHPAGRTGLIHALIADLQAPAKARTRAITDDAVARSAKAGA